jgi:hypothetical protein
MDKKHVSKAIKSSLGVLPVLGPLINALVPYNAKFAAAQKKTIVVKGRKGTSRRPRKSKVTMKPKVLKSIGSASYGPNHNGPELQKFRAQCDEAIGTLTGSAGPVFSNQRGTRSGISFKDAHMAQMDVDRSYRNAIRVAVTSVDGGSTSQSGLYPFMKIQGSNTGSTLTDPFQNGSPTGSNTGNLGFDPSTLSDSLFQIESIFEASAIRYCKIRYVPTAGDYTTMSINTNVSLGLCIANDEEANAFDKTFTSLSDFERFESNHVTKPFEIEYCHTGSSTWFTNAGDAEADLVHQGIILGAFDSNPTPGGSASAGPTYGHMTIFAIVDFYGLRPRNTNIVLRHRVDEKGKTIPTPLKPLDSDRLTESKATANERLMIDTDFVSVEQSPLKRQISTVTQLGSPRKELIIGRSKSVR